MFRGIACNGGGGVKRFLRQGSKYNDSLATSIVADMSNNVTVLVVFVFGLVLGVSDLSPATHWNANLWSRMRTAAYFLGSLGHRVGWDYTPRGMSPGGQWKRSRRVPYNALEMKEDTCFNNKTPPAEKIEESLGVNTIICRQWRLRSTLTCIAAYLGHAGTL